MENETGWFSVVVGNNWGARYLKVKETGKEFRFNKYDIWVKFPNGAVEKVTWKFKHGFSNVSDCGRNYITNWELPVIVKDYNGVPIEIDFEKVRVRSEDIITK